MQITTRSSPIAKHIRVTAVPTRLPEFVPAPQATSNDPVSSKVLETTKTMETVMQMIVSLPQYAHLQHYRDDITDDQEYAFRAFLRTDDRVLLLLMTFEGDLSNLGNARVFGSMIASKGGNVVVDKIELSTCNSTEAYQWLVNKAENFLLEPMPQETSV
jgi:hypothetical protein